MRLALAPAAAELYRLVLERNYDLLNRSRGAPAAGAGGGGAAGPGPAPPAGKAKKATLNNIVMELRKVCNHPYLVAGAEAEIEERARVDRQSQLLFNSVKLASTATLDAAAAAAAAVDGAPLESNQSIAPWTAADGRRLMVEVSSKLTFLAGMLPALAAGGHRPLIFSQFRGVLDILEDFLEGLPPLPAPTGATSAGGFARRRLTYGRIDGLTSGPRRQRIVDAFNAPDSRLFCLLMTTRAGGQGINLATADVVILFDSDWNPHGDRQAMARAHRFGQTRPVVVYRLLTVRTVEERILAVAGAKLDVERGVAAASALGSGTDVVDVDAPAATAITPAGRMSSKTRAALTVERE